MSIGDWIPVCPMCGRSDGTHLAMCNMPGSAQCAALRFERDSALNQLDMARKDRDQFATELLGARAERDECKTNLAAVTAERDKLLRAAENPFHPGDTVWLRDGSGPFVVVESGKGLIDPNRNNEKITKAAVVLLADMDGDEPDLPYDGNVAHCWTPGWIVAAVVTKDRPEPPAPPWWREHPVQATTALASLACALGATAITLSHLAQL